MSTAVTGGVGTAVPTRTTTYDPASGRAFAVTAGTGTGASSIRTGFDALGRQASYTDADGKVTTTACDALDRPVTVTDGVPSTTTFTYDPAVDPRGVLTSTTDSVAGTQTARYDADGDLTTVTLPGGYTMAQVQDPTGETTSRVYTRTSDDTVVVSNTVAVNVHGQVVTDTGTPGVTSSFTYGYDKASRLTRARQQNTDGTCTVRGYGFDKNSNRTGIATATSTSTGATGDGVNAACPAASALVSTSAFDTADRIIGGSVYDAFGRATSTPATASLTGAGRASTQSYYVDDLIRTQTTGATRTTWSLDPAGRFLAATAESNAQPDGSGAWTTASVKTNHYDSTGDSPRWITENATGTALTRYVDGIDGNLLASTTAIGGTVLQLSDIHGDTVLQLPLDTSVAPTALDTDGYGNPTTTARDAQARYGWLGAKQRSVETPTGMTLMGVRVYNPTTGRFLSTDPVPGGGANAYAYPTDPINGYVLDGQRWCKKWGCSWGRAARGAGRLAWRYKYDIALTAASFVPGVGAAAWAWRAYRIVRIARATRGMDGGIRATRATSWLASRMWARGGKRFVTDAGGRGRISGSRLRQYRSQSESLTVDGNRTFNQGRAARGDGQTTTTSITALRDAGLGGGRMAEEIGCDGVEGEQSDWWDAYDINGFVGVLSVRKGEMLIEGDAPTRYIQMFLDDRRSGVIADDFQNDADVCREIEEQLTCGLVDWYGRLLTLKRRDGGKLSN